MRLILSLLLLLHTTAALAADSYSQLLELFEDWRDFESPPLLDGAPDYTAARSAERHAELQLYLARLHNIDTTDWPVDQKVDWHLVRAEMNGFDFNYQGAPPSAGSKILGCRL